MNPPASTPAQNSFAFSRSVSEERVADLLCCALEGGTGYWCAITGYTKPPGTVRAITSPADGTVYKHIDYPLNEGGAVKLKDIEDDANGREFILDRKAIAKGLEVMAEKYPKHFGDFRAENEDAITADVFLQCCLFGKVIYG
jgi:hypothetical protein